MKRSSLVNLAVFILVLAALLAAANALTRRDDGVRKYGPFFEEKKDDAFDVLFFGTSHVLTTVLPTELWRDWGITSYNMGNNSEPLDATEWVLQLASARHKPKVAVIDVFYIDRAADLEWTYPFRHLFYDEVPLSRVKLKALRATLPEDMLGEFLFPFILYHGRWDELLAGEDVRQVESVPCLMGAELRPGRAVPNPYERTTDVADAELPGAKALRGIAAFCRENGIEPVFICVPSPATREEQMNCNTVYALAGELGVPFLNLLDVDGLVDFETDCYDSYSHLNPDGALKVTRYLGQWLTENFALEDHRQDGAYASWNGVLEAYDAYYDAVWADQSLIAR